MTFRSQSIFDGCPPRLQTACKRLMPPGSLLECGVAGTATRHETAPCMALIYVHNFENPTYCTSSHGVCALMAVSCNWLDRRLKCRWEPAAEASMASIGDFYMNFTAVKKDQEIICFRAISRVPNIP